MKKWIKWVIILVVIGIVATGSYFVYQAFFMKGLNAFDVKPDIEVTAQKVLDDFTSDSKKATSIYTNKENNMVIAISGKISEINLMDSTAEIMFGDQLSEIKFTFNNDYFKLQKEKIQKLKVNDELSIKGKCNGFMDDIIQSVQFDNCVIIDK